MPKAMPGTVHGGGDPHAGLDMGSDPHAGIDMGGMGGDPHAGMPAQPVDPSKFLRGTITATDATAAQIKPGDIIFLSAKPVNPATGAVLGNTIAAERIDVKALPIEWELTGANVMMPGTVFEGDVLILARVDRDGEARTRESGDIEGTVIATIPAENLALSLDTVVK